MYWWNAFWRGRSQSDNPGCEGMKQFNDLSPEAVKFPREPKKELVNFPGEPHPLLPHPLLACAFLRSCNPWRWKKYISTTIEGTSARKLCFECFNTQKLTPIHFGIQKPSLWNRTTMLSSLYFPCMLPRTAVVKQILLLQSFIFTSPLLCKPLSFSKRLKCGKSCKVTKKWTPLSQQICPPTTAMYLWVTAANVSWYKPVFPLIFFCSPGIRAYRKISKCSRMGDFALMHEPPFLSWGACCQVAHKYEVTCSFLGTAWTSLYSTAKLF